MKKLSLTLLLFLSSTCFAMKGQKLQQKNDNQVSIVNDATDIGQESLENQNIQIEILKAIKSLSAEIKLNTSMLKKLYDKKYNYNVEVPQHFLDMMS